MFKAMTMIDVKISSVPFTTIEPNIGVAHVITDCVCKEFGVKCKPNHGMCENGKRFIPVKLMDVAGLVPDAHLGKGLGNQFLDDLRQAAAFVHVIDTTGETDAEGKPTTGRDPEDDIRFLEKEIDYWFASIIERALRKFERELAKAGKADLTEILFAQLTGLEVTKADIEQALAECKIESMDLKDSERTLGFATALRKIAKPFVIAANKVDLSKAQENYERMKPKYPNMVPTSAEAEIALKRADEKGVIEYFPGGSFTTSEAATPEQSKALEFLKLRILSKYGTTGVQKCLDYAVFNLLGNIVVYPVANANKLSDGSGHVLPDAMLVPRGTTVRELAFRIHTDIGNKFVCGVDVRTKRRLAADYVLKDKDVVEIMTSK
jgi:hypothetical protein